MTEPTNQELLITAYEHLPTVDKVSVFEDIVCTLSADLARFDDPVLTRELDILDSIVGNIEQRLEEIKAVYGVE